MRWSVAALVAMVVLVMVVQEVDPANILFLAPTGPRSHKNFFMAIAEALATKNHTVTFVTGIEASQNKTNIREVFVPGMDVYKYLPNLFTSNKIEIVQAMIPLLTKFCTDALAYEGMQSVKEEKFDLVMLSGFGTECFYSLVDKFKVPYIFMYSLSLAPAYADMAHSTHFSSMVPNLMFDLKYPLTFTGRMFNTLQDTAGTYYAYYVIFKMMVAECQQRKLCPEDISTFYRMRVNGSLVILNSVETLEIPIRPYTATVVHAGGIHCKPAQPLPQELEDWIAEAGNAGFIFFSLGSTVKASTMPEEYRRVLVEVFASLKQRVLWKWDETMEDLPPNVRLAKWLPQQDILGDHRLRLFITHGGLLSIQEATYHGVPVLGIPVHIDQHHNIAQVQREGWGRFVYWADLTYDTLRQQILEVIQDTKMREVVTRRQTVMKDQPVPPGQWVTYWVEYVLRHHGALHLRSPIATMPWYELYNVDVWLVVLVVSTLAVILTFISLRALLYAVYTRLSAPTKHKQQ